MRAAAAEEVCTRDCLVFTHTLVHCCAFRDRTVSPAFLLFLFIFARPWSTCAAVAA